MVRKAEIILDSFNTYLRRWTDVEGWHRIGTFSSINLAILLSLQFPAIWFATFYYRGYRPRQACSSCRTWSSLMRNIQASMWTIASFETIYTIIPKRKTIQEEKCGDRWRGRGCKHWFGRAYIDIIWKWSGHSFPTHPVLCHIQWSSNVLT